MDVDSAVQGNAALSRACVIRDDVYPYPGNYFDACVSNYVVEHVSSPDTHLKEVGRVLRPGGAYLLRTPNLYHYVSLVSRLSPHWVHRLAASHLRDLTHGAHEPYPTVYQMNTAAAIRRLCQKHLFDCEMIRFVEKEPVYGFSSRALFLLFMAYERMVNSSEMLAMLRSNMFCVLRKPGLPDAAPA